MLGPYVEGLCTAPQTIPEANLSYWKHGGGHLSSKVLTDSIKLAAPGTGKDLSGYISSAYIFDSIKHNKLQDLEKYSMKSSDASAHVTSSKSNRKSTSSNITISPTSRIKHGRHRYTLEEDLALMKFVKEHFDCCPIKGNLLYKKAEKKKITSHSWQSMRDHYIKVLHKQCKSKEYAHLFIRTRTVKSNVGEKKKIKREETEDTSTHITTVDKDQRRVTRAQAAKRQEKIDSQNKCDTDADQVRMTRRQTSKVKEKIDSYNKSSETDDTDNIDDTSEDTDQAGMTKASKAKEKTKTQNKHDVTDDGGDSIADYLLDEARADNADDENSADEDVDYDKIFDDNLLKQAYGSKKKDSSEVDSDVTGDEDVAEETRVSSSQEMVNRAITRSQKRPTNEQEKISDFDGEIVFRKDLKNPSAKKAPSEDEEDIKRPIAKRSKRDFESSSDDENPSEKERKLEEAFLKYCQALRSNLQKLQAELTVPQIVHALLVSSGNLDDAEKYVQNGAGKEQWTSKEDKILLSKNKVDISSLAKKRGLHAVIDRMNFMEGIN